MMRIHNLESFDKSILCMTIMAIDMNHHMVTIVVWEVLNALKRYFLETKKYSFHEFEFFTYVETFNSLLIVQNLKSNFFLLCIINIDLDMSFANCV
jgi:hypothetical protein